ncbi:peptidylprolyl isomerase [Halobacteriaceae archaeon GCM10025711]
MGISTGDTVTLDYVGRLDDGTVFDTSREDVAEEADLETHPDREFEPLTVEIGAGEIIEGLEEGLQGMEVGDTDTVTIPPEKAYGEPSDERVAEYEAEEFAQMLQGGEPEEGMYVQTQQGAPGEVVHVDDELVRVDFNHELAGETLAFEVEILEVR